MESLQPRVLLQREFAQRCERNPRYSLRAFARSLGLSHSTLSMVLAGKRRLSRKMFSRVAGSLHLTDEESAAVSKLAGLDGLGFIDGPDEPAYRQISMDTYSVISDWYHYAILSLLDVRDSQFTANWISDRLGITEEQAQDAMERLIRLALVVKVGRRWKQSGLPMKIDNPIGVSTEAARRHHTQLLLKAIESLNHDSPKDRLFNGLTLAIDPDQLPHALERMRNFQRRLARELESKGVPKRVYSIGIQLYPIDKEAKRWV